MCFRWYCFYALLFNSWLPFFFVLEKQSFMYFNFCTFIIIWLQCKWNTHVMILSLFIFLLCSLSRKNMKKQPFGWRITFKKNLTSSGNSPSCIVRTKACFSCRLWMLNHCCRKSEFVYCVCLDCFKWSNSNYTFYCT